MAGDTARAMPVCSGCGQLDVVCQSCERLGSEFVILATGATRFASWTQASRRERATTLLRPTHAESRDRFPAKRATTTRVLLLMTRIAPVRSPFLVAYFALLPASSPRRPAAPADNPASAPPPVPSTPVRSQSTLRGPPSMPLRVVLTPSKAAITPLEVAFNPLAMGWGPHRKRQ